MPLLEMQAIRKRFGGTQALRDVSLQLQAGEVLALIGENGAGKSTLMKILSGAIPPDAGTMQLDGATYTPANPAAARRAGVAIVYQELTLAPHLSVEDNIMLGQERNWFGLLQRHQQRRKVKAALEVLGHADLRPETLVGSLSTGVQQLVEIARALVLEARLIVFDEPTSSLAQHDVARLFRVIRKLKERGLGIIYISHFLEEVREIGDRFAVLRDGQSVGEGVLAGCHESEIVALMVGRSVDDLFPQVPHAIGEPLLSVQHLSGQRVPCEVSFTLRRGEIFGLAGLVGAGRTETLRVLFGLDRATSGELRVGTVQPGAGPQGRIRAGIGMVSEDRKHEGLAQQRSIADNITLSNLQPYARYGILNLTQRGHAVTQWMQRLNIKSRSPEQVVGALSGGNQQKVAIARVLHQDAEILLLDEPTRGIDVGTKSDIYRLIGELAAEGKAVIFVSSYLPELMAVCDTIGVMARGRLRSVRPAREWTEEAVMACAISTET
ncbi:MAG TPA: sugar ABC transporter ATP-binding protein [Pirellulaceae bacterium]|nr:sugar ABC transporter ATP-binding protein [Pirellulaceae bacterium]